LLYAADNADLPSGRLKAFSISCIVPARSSASAGVFNKHAFSANIASIAATKAAILFVKIVSTAITCPCSEVNCEP